MIFQDPYSSLNGQKNIMSILAESLTAKKLDKKMIRDLLTKRKETIEYFGLALKENFYKRHYEFRNKANSIALASLPKVLAAIAQFELKRDESISQNFARLKVESLEQKEIMNYAVLNLSDDLVGGTFAA